MSMSVTLTIRDGEVVRNQQAAVGTHVVGRDSSCDVVLVSPDVSDAVKNYLRARTLTALERLALERTIRACNHAFTLIDGDYYTRASTKLLLAES